MFKPTLILNVLFFIVFKIIFLDCWVLAAIFKPTLILSVLFFIVFKIFLIRILIKSIFVLIHIHCLNYLIFKLKVINLIDIRWLNPF